MRIQWRIITASAQPAVQWENFIVAVKDLCVVLLGAYPANMAPDRFKEQCMLLLRIQWPG